MSAVESMYTDLGQVSAYREWRDRKLDRYPRNASELVVSVADPVRLSDHEYGAIGDLLERANMAIWDAGEPGDNPKIATLNVGRQYNMVRLDHNMGADDDSITELRVVSRQWRGSYIPYTDRPIHWHTDGYYNRPERQIRGLVLHCVSPAASGGENALVDHEVAYIHLRDANPEYIRALAMASVMTIPANVENGVELRPARSGPVFSVAADGSLHMRYTARSRSIEWSPDPLTREAVEALVAFLHSDSAYIYRARLQAGQGLICNNVLHDRAGFEDDEHHSRLFYRLRYYERVAGT